jgi:hypothetical protein
MDNSNHPPTKTKCSMAFLWPPADANYQTWSCKKWQQQKRKMREKI